MSAVTHDEDDSRAAESEPSEQDVQQQQTSSQEPKRECCAALSCETRIRLECWIRADTAGWRAPAFSSYAYLRDELKRLRLLPKARLSIATSVERALDEALLAMTPPRRLRWGQGRWSRWPRPWTSLKRFYSGSDIEQSWRAIHRAQAALYLLYPRRELVPQAEHVEAVVAELSEQAALLKSVTNLIAQMAAPRRSASAQPPTKPGTMLRGIYERAMDVSDNLQVEARALRNALMTASAAIFVALAAIGVAHLIEPDIIRLCVSKVSGEACPLAGSPRRFDVFAVELAGLLGGLLSMVMPLATGERIKTPYRIFNQQLVIKALAGAATAVGGVLLLAGGVIDTIKLESSTAILGYAVVFGFAQQIVTGAVDRRANSLAKQTPTAKSV